MGHCNDVAFRRAHANELPSLGRDWPDQQPTATQSARSRRSPLNRCRPTGVGPRRQPAEPEHSISLTIYIGVGILGV